SFQSFVQPKEQLLAVFSTSTKGASSSTASTSECYYYSTCKFNWARRQGGVPVSITKNLSNLDDMTPESTEFFLKPDFLVRDNGGSLATLGSPLGSKNKGSIKKNRKPSFFEQVFRGVTTNVDRYITIISSHDECVWEGFVMDGTLFLRGNAMESVDLFNLKKESIVAVIELAEECLKCHSLVVCFDKYSSSSSNNHLSMVTRIFLYIGFEIVAPGTFNHSNDFILVGMEL
ncbi:5525_t:CDS:2, partial [Funneliformis mosseae]